MDSKGKERGGGGALVRYDSSIVRDGIGMVQGCDKLGWSNNWWIGVAIHSDDCCRRQLLAPAVVARSAMLARKSERAREVASPMVDNDLAVGDTSTNGGLPIVGRSPMVGGTLAMVKKKERN